MDRFFINGPCKIKGSIKLSGSKNASLPILAATILFDEPVEIKNLPNVKDIETMLDLIKSLGFSVKKNKINNSVIIKKKKIKTFASYSLVKTMRAGILVLGPLVTKYRKATTSLPGGCLIGARPVNIHLNVLKKLGMRHQIKKGYIYANAKKGLKGSIIKFPQISVGATENAILAATLAEGKTILKNCAIEPEIKIDLTNFLNKAGAKIKWIGKRSVEVEGVKKLNSVSHSVMADRIECGTFCVVAAISKGQLKINGLNPKIISTEIKLLKKIGAKIKTLDQSIIIKGPNKIKNIKFLQTKEYDGFPTDLQAQFMALLCKADGRSVICESIFENRFMHVAELKRLGAKISIIKNKAIIKGNSNFEGAELMSSDLRASVALVIAAIVAKGSSIINRIYHLDRGYENIEIKLKKIGVNIKRLS